MLVRLQRIRRTYCVYVVVCALGKKHGISRVVGSVILEQQVPMHIYQSAYLSACRLLSLESLRGEGKEA